MSPIKAIINWLCGESEPVTLSADAAATPRKPEIDILSSDVKADQIHDLKGQSNVRIIGSVTQLTREQTASLRRHLRVQAMCGFLHIVHEYELGHAHQDDTLPCPIGEQFQEIVGRVRGNRAADKWVPSDADEQLIYQSVRDLVLKATRHHPIPPD
jgi:hypothetical protein